MMYTKVVYPIMIRRLNTFLVLFLAFMPITCIYAQNTFNSKEFDKTVRSRGWAMGVEGERYYGMGSAADSLGSNSNGYYFSIYNEDGELETKRYTEQSGVLYLSNLVNKIIISGDEAIIGMAVDGLKNQGELIYLDKETGACVDSLIIAPHIPNYNLASICKVDDNTIMVVISYLGPTEPATGLFLVRDKKVIADYSSSIPQFGQVIREAISVDDGFIIFFRISKWPRDNKDPNAYYSNWILKLDKEGKEVWQYITDQGPDTEQGIFWIGDIVVDDDGSMTMCNLDYVRYADTSNVFLRYRAAFHPQITKLDKDRNILWQRKMGNGKYSGIDWTMLHRIVKSHEGDGYVTAGHLHNRDFRFDRDANGRTFQVKGMLAKVSNEGDSLWMREYTIIDYAPVTHQIRTMEKTDDGGYVMYGYISFDSNLDVRPGDNGVEAWILKVDTHGCLVPGCHLGTTTSENEILLDVKVYPNPVVDQLYIWHSGGDRQYKLVDNTGACIREFEKKAGQETIIMNMSYLNSGMYYLHVKDSEGRQHIEKIVLK